MADSLSDRHFETFRRVLPGRKVQNRKDSALHSEEYATAVVDMEGNPVVPLSVEDLLQELLMELRTTNVHLAALTGLGVSLADRS